MACPRSTEALGIGLLASVVAFGFAPSGLRWEGGRPSFSVDPAGSADVTDGSDVDAVRAAFQAWEGVDCAALDFDEAAFMGPGVTEPDGANQVFWVEDADSWPTDEEDTLALTFTYTLDGVLFAGADIAFNGVNQVWTTDADEARSGAAVDIETVALHEIGHFFGLGHSNDPDASMFASNNKLLARMPSDDDVAGICYLYSNGTAPPGTDTEGRRPDGGRCGTGADCQSGICLDDVLLSDRYCVERCQLDFELTECPRGFVCEDVPGGGFLCVLPAGSRLCQPCDSGIQCSTGLCADVPGVMGGGAQRGFCTQTCDPDAEEPCPDGYRCRATAQAGTALNVCAPSDGVCNPQDIGSHNQSLNPDGSCDGGHRGLQYGTTGVAFCFRRCGIQDAQAGLSCPDLTDSLCIPTDASNSDAACITVRQVGERCFPQFCEPGAECFELEGGVFGCLRLCQTNEGCGANEQCQFDPAGVGACIPVGDGFKELGETCANDDECISERCRTRGNERRCTQPCDGATPCPSGFDCATDGMEGPGACWPFESTSDPGSGFCSCDIRSTCQESCDCDPDCDDSGCRQLGRDGWGVVLGIPGLFFAVFTR